MATRQDRHYGRVRPGGHGIPFGQTALTGQRLGFSVLHALAMTLSPFPAKRNGGGDFVIAGGIGNTAPRKSRQHRNRGNSQEQATSESRQLARAGNIGIAATRKSRQQRPTLHHSVWLDRPGGKQTALPEPTDPPRNRGENRQTETRTHKGRATGVVDDASSVENLKAIGNRQQAIGMPRNVLAEEDGMQADGPKASLTEPLQGGFSPKTLPSYEFLFNFYTIHCYYKVVKY